MPSARNEPSEFAGLARREAALGRRRYALILAALCQMLSFTLYSMAIWQDNPGTRFHATYAVLCRDPFTHDPVGEPQARHRILGPLIAYAVGLRGDSGQLVLIAATFLFLVLFYLFVRRRWDCEGATLFTALIATTPVVSTSQSWPGYSDILGEVAILVAMMVSSPWLTGPILFVGMLGDERCIAAAPLVALWHVGIKTDRRPAVAFLIRGLGSTVALMLWIAFYKWIESEFVRQMPDFDNDEFKASIADGRFALNAVTYLPGGVYYALRSAWLFPALAVARGGEPGRGWLTIAVGVATAAALIPGALVDDHSRCMAVAWPVVLIAADTVRRQTPEQFSLLVYVALVLNIVTPMYDVFARGFVLREPLLAELFHL
jgi:hypothetical protein